jgi:hypothetical protein
MKTIRTRLEMDKLVAESKKLDESNTEVVRSIRSDLMHISTRLNYLATSGTRDKRFKKAEVAVDKVRKILFDLQD